MSTDNEINAILEEIDDLLAQMPHTLQQSANPKIWILSERRPAPTMWYAPTLTMRSGRICAAKCSGWCCRKNKIQRDKTLKWGGGYDTIQIL